MMKRREFIAGMGATGLAVAAGARAAVAAPRPVAADSPAVYAPGPDGATVVWPVTEFSAGWVEYGEAGSTGPAERARGDGYGFVTRDDKVLRVRLTGLKPGGRYWFRTHTRPLRAPGAETVESRKYDLRTLDPAAVSTCFCIWNDTHDRAPTLARLAEMTREAEADFLFWNGDVSNNINDEAVIAGLYVQPGGGVNLAGGPPVLFSRGNHDVRGAQAHLVSRYVDFPGRRPFYSFRSGPVAGIVLDTGEDKPDDHPSFNGMVDCAALIREQTAWLEREIALPHIRTAPYRLVFCHIPLRWKNEFRPTYDAAGASYDHWSARGRDAWHDLLVRWGAQMVISGHTHEWHHMKATPDLPYEQLVGGGPALDDAKGQAVLIHAHATREALAFRLVSAAARRNLFETALAPRAG